MAGEKEDQKPKGCLQKSKGKNFNLPQLLLMLFGLLALLPSLGFCAV